MGEWILILLSAALVNNLALAHLIGISPLLATTRRFDVAAGFALTVVIVLPLCVISTDLLIRYVLMPFDAVHLQLPVLVLLTAVLVLALGPLGRRYLPRLADRIGVYLPFTLVNTLVMGAVLLNLERTGGVFQSLGYGLGAGLGFALVLLLVSALQERLDGADVPAAFRGMPIALIGIGLMSMAMLGLDGLTSF